MRLSEPRVAPLPEDAWPEELQTLMGPNAVAGNAVNVFRTLARHPGLMRRWMVFANHVMFKSSLAPRVRELVILRIGWLCRAGYEWGQHVPIGADAGLSSEEIRRIKVGPVHSDWSEADRALLEATDDLHRDAFVADDTWATLCRHFDEHQRMDLVFAVGQYNLVSMALNTFGVQLDEGGEGLERP